MANATTVTPSNFNADNVEFTEPRIKKNKDGVEKTISFVRYDGKPMWLETEWFMSPFGVSYFKLGDTDNVNWSVNLSEQANDLTTEEQATHFFNQMRAMEQRMIEFATKYSQIIFGEEQPEVVVKALFNKFVKQDKEKKYPARISPKIPRARARDGDEEAPNRPYIEFFRGSVEPVELTSFEQLAKLVPGRSCVRALIAPRIYFLKTKNFGISWDVISMKARVSSTSRPSGVTAFSDETAEEFVEHEAAAASKAAAAAAVETEDDSGGAAGGAGDAEDEDPQESSEDNEEDSSDDEDDEEEA